MRGAAARISGLSILTIYYLVTPAVIGALIPLAIYYLASRFTSQSIDAALGTAVAVTLLALLGEESRTFGNYFLGRPYQGKALLLSVEMAVFAAASIDFLRSATDSDYVLLFSLT